MRALRNKINELEAFIIDKNLDIICITEHWLREEEIVLLPLAGFKLAAHSTRTESKGGGTCIYIRDTLSFEILNFNVDFNIEKCLEFSAIVLIDFNLNVVAVYRSPSGSLDCFLPLMGGVLESLDVRRQTAVVGDFNVNFFDESISTTGLLDTMRSHNLNQTVFEPTRDGSCLDNIFLDKDLTCLSSGVYEFGLSDHKSQLVGFLACKRGRHQNSRISFRPITQRGINSFFNSVSEIDWTFIYETNLNLAVKFNKFLSLLESSYKQAFPEKKILSKN